MERGRREMPFETRPYIPWLPFVSNPLKKYKVDDSFITISTTTQPPETIALPVAVVRKQPGFSQSIIHALLDKGNVVVNDAGGHFHTLWRIQGASAFMDAVRGIHPNIRADVAEKNKFANVTDNDLADCVIYYPQLPTSVDRLLRAFQPEQYFEGGYKVVAKEGSWVRKGDVIAKYGHTENNDSVGRPVGDDGARYAGRVRVA
jgi:hypothetical protein